jgi:hypothetical protein
VNAGDLDGLAHRVETRGRRRLINLYAGQEDVSQAVVAAAIADEFTSEWCRRHFELAGTKRASSTTITMHAELRQAVIDAATAVPAMSEAPAAAGAAIRRFVADRR